MIVIPFFFFVFAGLLSGFYPLAEPPKDEIMIADAGPGVYAQVAPLTAAVNADLVKQTYDYSCGSAALATLLNYQLGESLTERQVIAGMLRYGDKEAIAGRRAFSLLDMKRFVERMGYKGVGYTATLEDLQQLGRPCIVPITVFSYRHFVVYKGIHRGHIFVADPWRGNSSYTVAEFEASWYRNAIFVVYPNNGHAELNALRLKEQDLRFIDEDTARETMFARDGEWPQARQWELEKTFPAENTLQSKQFRFFRSVESAEPAPATP